MGKSIANPFAVPNSHLISGVSEPWSTRMGTHGLESGPKIQVSIIQFAESLFLSTAQKIFLTIFVGWCGLAFLRHGMREEVFPHRFMQIAPFSVFR